MSENLKGKYQLKRFRHRWEGNVEMGAEGMNCGLGPALGRMTGSFENYNKISESLKEISRRSKRLSIRQEELCSVGL